MLRIHATVAATAKASGLPASRVGHVKHQAGKRVYRSMATATIDGGVLHLELRRWDKFLAVHGSLHIPLEHITAARADTAPRVPVWTKLIGTNFPGWKAAGTFFTSDGLAFYDYDAGSTCLVLDLSRAHPSRRRRTRRPADCRERCGGYSSGANAHRVNLASFAQTARTSAVMPCAAAVRASLSTR